MCSKATFFVALLLTIHAVHAPPADADPLQITSGFVFLNEDPAQSFGLDFGLWGGGFALVGEDTESHDYFSRFSPWVSPFRLQFSRVPDFSSNSSCPGCRYDGDLLFSFTPGMPTFSLRGALRGFPAGGGAPLTFDLVGAGRMIAGPSSVLFQFQDEAAPVPEPATFLLVAWGGALVLRRCRRPAA